MNAFLLVLVLWFSGNPDPVIDTTPYPNQATCVQQIKSMQKELQNPEKRQKLIDLGVEKVAAECVPMKEA